MTKVHAAAAALAIVFSIGIGRAVAQTPSLTIGDMDYQLQYTIGDEDSDIFFQTISSAVVGLNGQVVIADGRSSLIVSYAADGKHIWTVDSQGEGPGELNRPGGMTLLNDLLMVGNQRGTRIDYYSLSGDYQRSMPFSEFGLNRAGICGWLDDDTAVITHTMNASYGNHLYVVDWDSREIIVEKEFRLPGVPDPPPGFNIGTGCKVQDGSVLVSHAYTDGFWTLTPALEVDQFVSESDANFYPPVLTHFDDGSLSALFPVDVDFTIIGDEHILTNVRWPCEFESVEAYESAVKAGDDVSICRTLRLLDTKGGLISRLFSGNQTDAPFTYLLAAHGDWLVTQPDVDYPMAAVYRKVGQ